MSLYKNKFRIETSRLNCWDYDSGGYYFITICTHDKLKYFGSIVNDEMVFTEIGKTAEQYVRDIPEHYPYTEIDEFVIMPNHVHFILVVNEHLGKETQNIASLQKSDLKGNMFGPQSGNLGAIIRGFKAGVKKYATMHNIEFSWQESYYEHIIRNEKSYFDIKKYIQQNPLKWALDELYC